MKEEIIIFRSGISFDEFEKAQQTTGSNPASPTQESPVGVDPYGVDVARERTLGARVPELVRANRLHPHALRVTLDYRLAPSRVG